MTDMMGQNQRGCKMTENTPWTYATWIASKEYQAMRLKVFSRFCHRCALCYDDRALECHHRHYKRGFGKEWVTDFVLLCAGCHRNHEGIFKLARLEDALKKASSQIIEMEGTIGYLEEKFTGPEM